MATKRPLRPCAHYGCHNYAKDGFNYCELHLSDLKEKEKERQRLLDSKRKSSYARGYNSKWQKVRQTFLNAHPLCNICGKPANEVDHIVPHKGNLALFWDRNNWQALCKSCHSRKTATEDSNFSRSSH